MVAAAPLPIVDDVPGSAPRDRANDAPEDILRALCDKLADLRPDARARAIMAPEVIAAAAALSAEHAEIQAVRAALRAVRAETSGWTKAVNAARAVLEQKAREDERRAEAARIDPTSMEGRLKKIAGDLQCNNHGKPLATHDNLAIILANDPRWEGVLAYHALRESVWIMKPPPWHDDLAPDGGAKKGEWTEADATRMSGWLSREWGLHAKTSVIIEAVIAQAFRHVVDPVRMYLDRLPQWDGVPRLDTWLVRHFRADDTPYVRAVSRRWMIAGVARALRPGCKADHALVLVGGQGKGKSSALGALCPDESLFADLDLDGNKDDAQNLVGKWIIELGELSAMGRLEIRKLKRWIALKVDRYRASYARVARDYLRRVLFAATCNDEECLRDPTGDRRWWPVDVADDLVMAIVVAGIIADRDQMWAEALHYFNEGEPWYLETAELEGLAREEQEAHRKADPWEDKIRDYLGARLDVQHVGGDGCRCAHCYGVTVSDVLTNALNIDVAGQDDGKAGRVRAALKVAGWSIRRDVQRRVPRADGKKGSNRVRPFFPPPDPVAVQEAAAVDALAQEEQRIAAQAAEERRVAVNAPPGMREEVRRQLAEEPPAYVPPELDDDDGIRGPD